MKNIVVTGLGIVSPIGNDILNFKESLKKGKSGIDYISSYDIENKEVKIAGEIKNIKFSNYMTKKTLRRTGRATRMAITATRQAIEDSKLDLEKCGDEVAVVIGSTLGETGKMNNYFSKLKDDNHGRADSYYMMFANDGISGYIATEFNIKGINYSISCACCSANVALIEAAKLIKLQRYKYVIVCGVEAPIFPLIMKGFNRTGVFTEKNTSQKAVRPFDKLADGFVGAEGAGCIIIEDSENATNRDTDIYCKVSGTGYTCDAVSMTAVSPTNKGKIIAIKKALEEAKINYRDIDCISPYGSGLKHIDIKETELVKEVFKEKAYNLYISSIKSMIGHSFGASAALENISAILGLKYSFIPPTINYENPYDKCDLNYVPNTAIDKNYNKVLKLSYGTGNKNTAVIFESV